MMRLRISLRAIVCLGLSLAEAGGRLAKRLLIAG